MNIVKTSFAQPMIDLMEGCDCWEIDVDGQHGRVSLIDLMPRLVPAGRTADTAVLRSARTSTGQGVKSLAEDRTTQRYLARHSHTTPSEAVTFTFHMVLPIFVARQWIRHRMAHVNEYSLRYSEAKDRFWFPPSAEYLRGQSKTGSKQHTEGGVDLEAAALWIEELHNSAQAAMSDYQNAVKNIGIGRELARINLPVNLMTEWFWGTDLHNLLRTLSLRMDKHAQAEIQVYANALYELVKPLVPDAIEAFDDYDHRRGGLLLSRLDLLVLNDGKDPGEVFTNNRELLEFVGKCDRLGEPELAGRCQAIWAGRDAASKRDKTP